MCLCFLRLSRPPNAATLPPESAGEQRTVYQCFEMYCTRGSGDWSGYLSELVRRYLLATAA